MNDINQQLIQTLQNKFGSQFIQYYDGDPIGIPQSALPCIIVDRSKDAYDAGPTGMDRITYTVTISIALDKTADFGQDSEQAITTKKLRDYVALFNDQGQYDAASIMGTVRTDLTLAGYLVSQKISVDYGTQFRQPTGTITAEARITMDCTKLIVVQRVPQPN